MQKPINSFLLFCREHRSIVQEANPDFSNAEVTSKLGVMWRAMSKESKEKYVAQAKVMKLVSSHFLNFSCVKKNISETNIHFVF